ncbi:hypothetical protein HDU97_002721 [Phlyctochytrium planicorne]|nr:hypothetical protein HDU97_002721 [Phlyctochytrium planicorne]
MSKDLREWIIYEKTRIFIGSGLLISYIRTELPKLANESVKGCLLFLKWPQQAASVKLILSSKAAAEKAKKSLEEIQYKDNTLECVHVGSGELLITNLPDGETIRTLTNHLETLDLDQFAIVDFRQGSSAKARDAIINALSTFGNVVSLEMVPSAEPDFAVGVASFGNLEESRNAAVSLNGAEVQDLGTVHTYLKPIMRAELIIPNVVFEFLDELVTVILDGSPDTSYVIAQKEDIPLTSISFTADNPGHHLHLLRRMNMIVKGRIITEGKVTLWDSEFMSEACTIWFQKIGRLFESFIYPDVRRKCLVVFGPADLGDLVSAIQVALDLLKPQNENAILHLNKDQIRKLVRFGTKKLAALASARSLSLDVVKQTLSVDGTTAVVDFVSLWLGHPKQVEERVPGTTTVDCDICFSDFEIEDVYILPDCAHVACPACLKECITTPSVDTEERFPIKCWAPKCQNVIDLYIMQEVVPKKEFSKLVMSSYLEFINANGEDFQFCPTLGCPQIYRVNSHDSVCDHCGAVICTMCGFSHEGFACEAFWMD